MPGFSRSLGYPLPGDSNSRIWGRHLWDPHVPPPPILHCNCPRKLYTVNSGSSTFPKSTVSLIRALSSSCLHQFSTVPSGTLIRLTCTTEFRYAATSGPGKAYVTAGPYMQVTTSPSPLIIPIGSDLIARHKSVKEGMPPFASFNSSFVVGFFSSPVRCRFCIKRYSTNNVFSRAVPLYE